MKVALLSLTCCISFLFLSATVYSSAVVPFSSPENSYATIMDYLESLNQSIYLSGYTFTSEDIAAILVGAKNSGLDVKVLMENTPVGGISNISKSILCNLYMHNITIDLYTGDLSFLHAKYIIGDNKSVLVASENFGSSGYPKSSTGNRGWGALAFNPEVSKALLNIFLSDIKNSENLVCETGKPYKPNAERRKADYTLYKNQDVKLISAPENAVENILDLLNSANKSIYIEQLYIKNWRSGNNPFLEAAISRSRAGVEVKVLLDSSQYDLYGDDNNVQIAEYINNISRFENVSLEAKLIDLQELGFREAHTKGVVVDNKKVLVSSINWNENSPKNNREVGLIITGDAASHFSNLFMKDWHGTTSITGKIIEESKNQILYIIVFIFVLSGVYYFAKHRPRKSKTFLS